MLLHRYRSFWCRARKWVRERVGWRYPVRLRASAQPARGRALLSYIADAVVSEDDSPSFRIHNNVWQCREIARLLVARGYDVDAINWDDRRFVPRGDYDVVVDICYNLARMKPMLGPRTVGILHCTGSDPGYQNAAELARVSALNARREGTCLPKRVISDPNLARASLLAADGCSLIGDGHTLATYSSAMRGRMRLVRVAPCDLGNNIKPPNAPVPPSREFLWFAGSGAVHKGLDLVLDVFARHPQLTLNVVGSYRTESDFTHMYRRELFHCPNIREYGRLDPASAAFGEIVSRCFCFVAPTCSEGTSAAVVACLQVGLLPIVSADTGVDLPENAGYILADCTAAAIEEAVQKCYLLGASDIQSTIGIAQAHAAAIYTYENFSADMGRVLDEFLAETGPLGNGVASR